jgi:nucleolar protein 53
LIKSTERTAQSKRHRVAYVSHKELTRLRNVANGHHTNEYNVEETELLGDPWDLRLNLAVGAQDLQFSFLPKPQKIKAPKTLQRKPISLTASGKLIPPVRKPDGGYSYNPAYTDYEERLKAEGDREVRAEQKRLAAAEVERLKNEAASISAAEAEAAEAKADLSKWEEDSAWEGFESGTEDNKLKVKRPKRKTQAQRNRIKRRKEEERKAKMVADIKRKDEQVTQIRKLAEEMKTKWDALSLTVVRDDESSNECDYLELRRRKLGNIALPEKQLELVLPDELQESLRLLKPEGNLLRDRYRSFLVRGKLECRKPISLSKKAKTKATEKWAHKDFMLH